LKVDPLTMRREQSFVDSNSDQAQPCETIASDGCVMRDGQAVSLAPERCRRLATGGHGVENAVVR
ncbi:MAG: hypothetical protein J0H75_16460, partial [Rhizobiales bacterium]|nr:hypothetical protein [Hyphomicrobiales bacterium]